MGKTVFGFILGILIVPVIGAAVVLTGHFPFEATARPPDWEKQIASMALDPALGKKMAGLTNPITANDANLLKGMKLYRDDCAKCHGGPGKPSRWGRNNFYPSAPQFGERGIDDPIPQVYVVAKYGIRYTGMAGWKDEMSDDDLWRVATFLTRVESLPPAVASAWKSPR